MAPPFGLISSSLPRVFVFLLLFSVNTHGWQQRQKRSPQSQKWHPISYREPRVFASQGCSGSTIGMSLLFQMIHAHGLETVTIGRYELLNPKKNNYASQHKVSVAESLKHFAREAVQKKQIFLFKADLSRMSGDVRQALQQLNSKYIIYWRKSALDHFICEIKDCWSNLGYPVDENGEKSDLCFERRKYENEISKKKQQANATEVATVDTHRTVVTKAYFQLDTAKARARVRSSFHDHNIKPSQLIEEQYVAAQHAFYYEDLTGYEYRSATWANITHSQDMWFELLQSLGLRATKETIRKVLMESARERDDPAALCDKVYNCEELTQVLSTSEEGYSA